MNRHELEAKLKSEGVNPRTYAIGHIDADVSYDERYCLEQNNLGWSVYYRERGNRNCERKFQSEAEACDYFLEEILQDPTTRR